MWGQPHQHFAETDSTNRVALDWLHAPHGALVTADAQTQGRGRLGRAWSSPPGAGLYLSLVVHPALLPSAPHSLVAALAVAEAVEAVCGMKAQIKWPNDILIRERKVGGLLCEVRGERLVIGVGLNLDHTRDQLPARPLFSASSLQLECGRSFLAGAVRDEVLSRLETRLNQPWPQTRAPFVARMWGLGEFVRVGNTPGKLMGVSDEGALELHTSGGLQFIMAGDLAPLEGTFN